MSAVLTDLLDLLEDELRTFIDDEKTRVESERDFLRAVLDGRADDVSVDSSASALTEVFLSGYVAQFFPVEDDISPELE